MKGGLGSQYDDDDQADNIGSIEDSRRGGGVVRDGSVATPHDELS